MPSQFQYSGVDASGHPISGLFEAESPIDVVLQLKNAGVTVYSLKKKRISGERPVKTSRTISPSDLIAFNSQLASLLKTRLPLAESLHHLAKEMKRSRLKTALERVVVDLEAGQDLSESLRSYKNLFPPLYLSMVEAGEKSGNLAEVLFHVSEHFKAVEDFRRKVLGVVIYPSMLTVLAVGVLVFLVKLMVPPYVEMYSGFHAELPTLLRLLVASEELLRLDSFLLPSAIAALAILIVLVFVVRRNETLSMYMDRLILRIPLWGQMVRDAVLVRSMSTLAVILKSGIPLYESLNIVKNIISNRPLKTAFESAADHVFEGDSLSQPLVKQPVFPIELAWVIRNGEVKGDLVGALDNAKKICQSRFEFSSRVIVSILEPVLLIGIGALVVSVAISLFYPLYSLSKYLGT